jgi:hypothetical protein
MECPVCHGNSVISFSVHDGVSYFECTDCGSLFADPAFLAGVDAGTVKNYENSYWEMETQAARERSFGSTLPRVAETFLYCRIPINNFIDIGSGPGFLLDSLSVVMPASRDVFHGVEMFPPVRHSSQSNYHVGTVGDVPLKFEAGCCIEVIEHLTPDMLNRLIEQLATRSQDGALYYFNSGQPAYVKFEDPEYLDPYRRGHILSYSIDGVSKIFQQHGFLVIPLPGRNWAFLAEFGGPEVPSAEDLLTRIWTAQPENVRRLKDSEFGPLMYHIGIESARCYLEHAIGNSRASWALSLDKELASFRNTIGRLVEPIKTLKPPFLRG